MKQTNKKNKNKKSNKKGYLVGVKCFSLIIKQGRSLPEWGGKKTRETAFIGANIPTVTCCSGNQRVFCSISMTFWKAYIM